MKPIVVIVGGPPNSGKSTFSESLARALWKQGTSAEAVDLDPWSPTIMLIRGEISKEERERLKRRKIGEEEISDAVRRLRDAKEKYEFVIGDAPGGISDELKPVYEIATHAIILCREDREEEIGRWGKFFNDMNIPIIAIIISRTSGIEGVSMGSNGLIEGTLVGLNRAPIDTPAMSALASMLRYLLSLV